MEIVDLKIKDLNTDDREVAAKIVAGSARSIGIDTNYNILFQNKVLPPGLIKWR